MSRGQGKIQKHYGVEVRVIRLILINRTNKVPNIGIAVPKERQDSY
jgi:hypothetical protein